MRTAPALVLAAAILAGCSTPDPGTAFVAALQQAPADGLATLEWQDGQILRYRAPLADAGIPAAARRTADEYIQPEGKSVFRGEEWGPAGHGYRFVKDYAAPDGRRSVLVTGTGDVLERSHEIPVAECPEAARTAVAKLGTIQRVEVVQRGASEQLRMEVHQDGARWSVLVDLDGRVLARDRLIEARLKVRAPH